MHVVHCTRLARLCMGCVLELRCSSLLPLAALKNAAGFWAGLVVERNEDKAIRLVHTLHGFMSEVNNDILLAVITLLSYH